MNTRQSDKSEPRIAYKSDDDDMPWEKEVFKDGSPAPKIATPGINSGKPRYQVNADFGGIVMNKTEPLLFPPKGPVMNGHYESTDGDTSPQGEGIHVMRK
jgi:hypothetical protein